MKLIDKDKIAAEIEKRLKEYRTFPGYQTDSNYMELCEILSFINTLETKDVDLKKEIEDWVKTGPHTSYPWCTIPDAIRITAEHFFELGLQTQKGE